LYILTHKLLYDYELQIIKVAVCETPLEACSMRVVIFVQHRKKDTVSFATFLYLLLNLHLFPYLYS
jgi:hypothetical protein